MHICMDEIMAFFAAVPLLGYALRRIHTWWHRVRCPHRPGLFAAFRGHQGTVLMSATPPEDLMTPEELDVECKKLDAHFSPEARKSTSTWDADDTVHYVDGGIS